MNENKYEKMTTMALTELLKVFTLPAIGSISEDNGMPGWE